MAVSNPTLPACPENKFGFTSDCIFCSDRALESLVENLGPALLLIVLLSFLIGLLARRNNLALTITALAAVTLSLIVFAITDLRWFLNAVVYAGESRHTDAIICIGKLLADKVSDAQTFAGERFLKGWGVFSITPFAAGLAIRLLFRSDRRPSA
jgi:hypothetical protein